MGFKLHDLATMKAIAKMERANYPIHHEVSVIKIFYKFLVILLFLFIVGYIVGYQTVIVGNSIWGAWAGGGWLAIELVNFVWFKIKVRAGN